MQGSEVDFSMIMIQYLVVWNEGSISYEQIGPQQFCNIFTTGLKGLGQQHFLLKQCAWLLFSPSSIYYTLSTLLLFNVSDIVFPSPL